MKTTPITTLLVILGLLSRTVSEGQTFSSGSDGSYGPLDISGDTTLDLPANGIFHCTTISVTGGTLRFKRNALNTPVYLLATGDVTIVNASIDVSGTSGNDSAGGQGGPGGFDGGSPGTALLPPGAGYGPGAGRGGTTGQTQPGDAGGGSYGAVNADFAAITNRGSVYGSPLLIPLVGGSGGGGSAGNPGFGGGGGGGAILIASNTRITANGDIRAWAGVTGSGSTGNAGSGGAIRLVAPVVAGSAQLIVKDPSSGGDGNGGGGGGFGRIRVDTLDRSGFNLSFSPTAAASVGKVMIVFPNPLPRLDIIEAAGRSIPEGTTGPVTVLLPAGASASQTIKVQARDFLGVVPITVVLTPQHGEPSVYSAEINLAGGNPAQVTVNVVIPVNVETTVNAWTR